MFSLGTRTVIWLSALALVFPMSVTLAAQQTKTDGYYHPSGRVANIPDVAADAKAHGPQSIRHISPLMYFRDGTL